MMADRATRYFVLFLWLIAGWFTLITSSGEDGGALQLKMANLVYRHGDRSPITTYPNDQHFEYWKNGLGQLTEKGMGQEFAMGQFIRERYSVKLLNRTYLRKQVYCRSTDIDRTLMSAEAQMAGLYPPKYEGPQPKTKQWHFWQLVPIHTVSQNEDHLLRVAAHCPRYNKIFKESFKKPEYRKMQKQYKDFIHNVSIALGLKQSLTLSHMSQVRDMFFCQRAHNLSLPSWVTSDVLHKLELLNRFNNVWAFNSHEKQRLSGGTLIGELVGNMKNYLADPGKSKKLFVYSAHDSTLVALLSALHLYNGLHPGYSSLILVELYQNKKTKEDIVRIFYRNDSKRSEPYELTLPHCSPCTLEKFKSMTADMIPSDYETECGNDRNVSKQSDQTCKGWFAAFVLVLVLTFIVVVGLIVRHYLQKRSDHSRRGYVLAGE